MYPMKKNDIVKCRYSKCLHESQEMNKKDAIQEGNSYYHPDCFRTKEEIKEIIDLFAKYINPNPVYAQLHKVINTIVFDKGLGSEFLLFGLRYYITHKIPLNYPGGLYYVVQNKEVLRAYNKEKIKKEISANKDRIESQEYSEDNSRDFGYIPQKPKTIEDVVGA